MERVRDAVRFVHVPHMSNIRVILYNGWFTLFSMPITALPSAGGECMFISVFIFLLSFDAVAVNLPLALVFM